MAATTATALSNTSLLDRKLKSSPSKVGVLFFLAALAAGVVYIVFHVAHDLDAASITSYAPYGLLGLALLIALGFEFVNGFHDTANAVATVIYTHSLEPNIAVVWSGMCNLAGVLLSSGTVAFAVITLLPVELILQVSSRRGLRHGLRTAHRRDPLEPRHLVARTTGVKFAHHGRLHHRRRHRQPVDAHCTPEPAASTGNRQ